VPGSQGESGLGTEFLFNVFVDDYDEVGRATRTVYGYRFTFLS